MNEFPWDDKPPEPSIHLSVTAAVGRDTTLAVDEFQSDTGIWAANLRIDGEGWSNLTVGLGVGYKGNEDIVAVADRLIEVLHQARANALRRLASAVSFDPADGSPDPVASER